MISIRIAQERSIRVLRPATVRLAAGAAGSRSTHHSQLQRPTSEREAQRCPNLFDLLQLSAYKEPGRSLESSQLVLLPASAVVSRSPLFDLTGPRNPGAQAHYSRSKT